ncbi:MAG: orotate phosphoribosyltransferase, partial [FCB group bacterium]|nr:orotate phosphoribosyltransferase [FCB group bacterium]
IVLGTELGRQCGVRSIFAERENGRMTLRRGLEIRPGERVLVVEDVITTGGSVREVMELVQQVGGTVIGVGIVVDRSNGTVVLHDRQVSLLSVPAVSYPPDQLPEELKNRPAIKPGSRGMI